MPKVAHSEEKENLLHLINVHNQFLSESGRSFYQRNFFKKRLKSFTTQLDSFAHEE
jgi:hypothetical protein